MQRPTPRRWRVATWGWGPMWRSPHPAGTAPADCQRTWSPRPQPRPGRGWTWRHRPGPWGTRGRRTRRRRWWTGPHGPSHLCGTRHRCCSRPRSPSRPPHLGRPGGEILCTPRCRTRVEQGHVEGSQQKAGQGRAGQDNKPGIPHSPPPTLPTTITATTTTTTTTTKESGWGRERGIGRLPSAHTHHGASPPLLGCPGTAGYPCHRARVRAPRGGRRGACGHPLAPTRALRPRRQQRAQGHPLPPTRAPAATHSWGHRAGRGRGEGGGGPRPQGRWGR